MPTYPTETPQRLNKGQRIKGWSTSNVAPGVGARLSDVHARRRSTPLLRANNDLATLRDQARAGKVDPDLVEQGYRDMRDGLVTMDQVVARLRRLDHA